jgi:hypothetical protein
MNDLEDMSGALKGGETQFIGTYQSSRKPWVEEELRELNDHLYQASQLEQSLYNGFEKMYSELYAADGNNPV